ncbi:MAG TPA: DUF3108 domain-containing protein [Anaeromyxobacteraceae bacterium]|nr:DUF3108 domain-containing protein [Anaeromyxobacteraceae bacterium]
MTTCTPTTLLAAALLALPAAARAVEPGEETVLAVSYLGIPTGEGRIAVGRPEGDVLPVFFQVRSGGAASLVDIREHLVVYWDVAERLTRGSDLRAIELGDRHHDRTRFDRTAGQVTVTVQREGRTREKRAPCPPDGHDLTGAFLFLRLQALAAGQRYELPVCSGAEPFTLVARVEERERVKTPAGEFDALRVAIRTEIKGKFNARRDILLWFSDDPRHVLVKMSAEFAVGSVVATLKRYTPGESVAALRPAAPPAATP